MKLYTEEQIREIYFKGVHNGRMQIEGKCSDEINLITPIKLPSDEEIEKQNPFVWGSHVFGTRDSLIWEQGTKWMRDKVTKNK